MNSNSPILKIKDLKACINNNEILRGLNLTINRGEIHAIMGPNGSGKSTLLETLGMMNNTIVDGSIKFYGDKEESDKPLDIAEFWKRNNQQEISGLRKKHFTFIFQQTNLMDNFP